MIIKTILILIFVYLLGSISGSIIISKNFFREDIRLKGSGNAGTTNAFRAYGVKYAALAMSIDFIKTILAMLIADKVGLAVGASEFTKYISGVVVVIGHIWPIYYNFKGGKGVACSIMVNLYLSPIIVIIQLIEFFTLNYIFRIMSLTSLILTYSAVIYQFIKNNNLPMLIMLIVNAIIITYSHRENVKRLFKGKENKIERLGKR
ncbi:glycerol-3-phosphate 1-O-acyltransferase PlsY [Helcococcus sueciensis]|uniref:glycerol-3-phosphate 1-O-acyltransferase PlsY n=1 Tax=Helcococcus sueciensis TaxID=241555 RepID=UPI0003FA6166|nr:glycerol-3-phosphate 1-O-acyltransferase PlsY [Helcococcus sueciensis]